MSKLTHLKRLVCSYVSTSDYSHYQISHKIRNVNMLVNLISLFCINSDVDNIDNLINLKDLNITNTKVKTVKHNTELRSLNCECCDY